MSELAKMIAKILRNYGGVDDLDWLASQIAGMIRQVGMPEPGQPEAGQPMHCNFPLCQCDDAAIVDDGCQANQPDQGATERGIHVSPEISETARSVQDEKDLAELRQFFTREGAIALLQKYWPDLLVEQGEAEPVAISEWQTMNHGPKNGAEIILEDDKGHRVLAHWMVGGHCIEDHPPIDAGWYFWNGFEYRPLPNPRRWASTSLSLYAAAPRAAVPDGWKLVPMEPDDTMVNATFAGMVEDQSVPHQMQRRAEMKRRIALAIAAAPEQGGE